MEITKSVVIDLSASGVPPVVDAMQGDEMTRAVKFYLYDGSVPFMLSGVAGILLGFKKPDGVGGLYDELPNGQPAYENIQASGNAVVVYLAPAVLEIAGNVDFSVVLRDSNLRTLATFPIRINVIENPAYSQSVSNDYYAVKSLSELNNYLSLFMKKTADSYLDMEGNGIYDASFVEIGTEQGRIAKLVVQPSVENGQETQNSVLRIDNDQDTGAMILRGLRPPVEDSDAANKAYVDSVVSSGGSVDTSDCMKKVADSDLNMSSHNIDEVSMITLGGDQGSPRLYEGTSKPLDDTPVLQVDSDDFYEIVIRGVANGKYNNDAVNLGQLNAAVGDIESALDSIIAIQNGLIGGETA